MSHTYTYRYVTDHDINDGFVLDDGDPGFTPVSPNTDRFSDVLTHDTIEHMRGIGNNGWQNELSASGAILAGRYGCVTGIKEDDILSGITSVLECIEDFDDDTVEDETGITIGLRSVLDTLHTEMADGYIISVECKEMGLNWLAKHGSSFPALTYNEELSLELVTLIIAHMSYGYDEFIKRCNGSPSYYPFDTVMSAINDGMEDIKQLMNDRGCDEFWEGFKMVLTVSDDWYSGDLVIHRDTLNDIDLDFPELEEEEEEEEEED